MKLKNVLLTGLSFVLVAAVAIGGTLAYLTSTDDDVNVMTLGNVKIEQHEYERVVNADGTYATKTIDNVTSYVLKDFTQAKPLLPSAIDTTTWEGWDWDSTIVRMTQVGSYGGMNVFKEASNAQDKFVTVENTGDTDAYIRTLVAIEIGSTDGSLIGTSYHSTWTDTDFDPSTTKVSDPLYIQIDGKNYMLQEYIYAGGQLSDGSWRHGNGILPAGDTSYPNLSQVYIKSAATNEDMKALDGNGNGTLDILVISQAVQAAGFANAETALDTAFGDITTTNHPWADGVKIPVVVNDVQGLSAAIAAGQDVILSEDITVEAELGVVSDVVVDLNGHTITGPAATVRNGRIFQVTEGNSLTIKNGKISSNGYAIVSGGNGSEVNTVVLENVEMSTTTVGVYHNGNAYGVNVVIKDSKIVCSESSSTAVFLSGSKAWGTKKSSLSVENSTLQGGNAIEVKYCDVSVKNSTLTATATPDLRVGVSGGCAAGYALALTNNGNDEDSFGIVTIENTTITGPVGIKAKGELRILTEAEYTETAKIINN